MATCKGNERFGTFGIEHIKLKESETSEEDDMVIKNFHMVRPESLI